MRAKVYPNILQGAVGLICNSFCMVGLSFFIVDVGGGLTVAEDDVTAR